MSLLHGLKSVRHQLQAIWLCGFIPSFIQSEGKEQKDIDLKPISQNTALITTTLNSLGLHQNTSAQWRTEFVKNQNVLPVSSIYGIFFPPFFFQSQKLLLRVLLQCDAVKTMTHYAYAIPTCCFIIYRRGMPIHCSFLLNVHETLRPYGNSQFVFIVREFLETHTRVLTFHRREVNHYFSHLENIDDLSGWIKSG